MSIKKIFGQADENGTIRIAFVGTEEELQAQIDKDYAEAVKRAEEALAKYKEEAEKAKGVDFSNLTPENVEEACKYAWNKKMAFKTEHDLKEFKKPTVKDGTYFILEYIGKLPEMEERK